MDESKSSPPRTSLPYLPLPSRAPCRLASPRTHYLEILAWHGTRQGAATEPDDQGSVSHIDVNAMHCLLETV